jgi:hypothetical protein
MAQPTSCQFAEHFTLALYRKGGWDGHRYYALSEPVRDPRAAAGLAHVRRCFGEESLSALAQERAGMATEIALPSLFLFRSTGEVLFLEVTRGRERVPQAQLQGLAQIRRILGAEVGVVYVKPHGPWYEPRHWELDLAAGCGRLLPRERDYGPPLTGLWNMER